MAKEYFRGLNYTLGNEDTSLENSLVRALNSKSIFAVCGSGGRSLSLLNKSVEKLTLSDLSNEQILLAKLRHNTYKQLSYNDFILFWGYYPFNSKKNANERKKIFINLDIDLELRDFFEKVFNEINFNSILYIGKWERTFNFFSKINRFILGKDFDKVFMFDNVQDQIKYYENEFPIKRWRIILSILGNKTMFNALLYKGNFIQKNSPESHFNYYFNAFDRLFRNDLAKKSFFLNLCFFGKINFQAGVPIEGTSEKFSDIKESNVDVKYVQKDMVTYLKETDQKYDFLSLSDVPSYFSGEYEKNYMQMIRPSLEENAHVVVRYYLRTSDCILDGYEDVTNQYIQDIKNEKVQMYNIKIYKYLGNSI